MSKNIADPWSLDDHEKEVLQDMIDGMTNQCLAGNIDAFFSVMKNDRFEWNIMKENKYYIPTIDEFHVGFEYEVYEPDYGGPIELEYNWSKEIFAEYTFDSEIETIDGEMPFSTGILENRIRVKYLDKEDIESLGFVQITEDSFYKTIRGYRGHDCPEVKILIRDTILIWIVTQEEEAFTLFTGTIKNKSELVKLLKQLGIDE